MISPCARCGKPVYPVEKLSCLDKTWHKKCFTCEVCGMVLNMKNYKGFQKKPYCNAHYPKLTATSVADTPEARRLAAQTKLQSQVEYHAEYEKTKADFTNVADTPESRRLAAQTKLQSQVEYHSEYEKTKAQFTEVADTPAMAQVQRNNMFQSQAKYDQRDDTMTQSDQGYQAAAPVNPMNPSAAPPAAVQPTSYAQPEAPAEPEPEPAAEPAAPAEPAASSGGPKHVALYDYDAGDTDEVSFVEGDIILDGQIVAEGWMEGTVERTGARGLLPSNYVEAK